MIFNQLTTNIAKMLLCVVIIFTITASSNLMAQTPAPDFSLPQYGGGLMKLADYRGKVVYVDFWASWCLPCRKSFPWMNSIQSKYKHKDFVVLAINLDKNRALAEKFLQKIPVNFKVAFDTKAVTPAKYGLKGMPTSYLVDRLGNINSIHPGFNSNKTNHKEQAIQALLQQK